MSKKTTAETPEKDVKIKLATGLTYNGKKHVAGEVVEVGETLASRLVDRKQAAQVVPAEPQKPAEPQQTTEPATVTPDPKEPAAPAAPGDPGDGKKSAD